MDDLSEKLEQAFNLLYMLADVTDWEEIPEVSCRIIEKESDSVKLNHIERVIDIYKARV